MDYDFLINSIKSMGTENDGSGSHKCDERNFSLSFRAIVDPHLTILYYTIIGQLRWLFIDWHRIGSNSCGRLRKYLVADNELYGRKKSFSSLFHRTMQFDVHSGTNVILIGKRCWIKLLSGWLKFKPILMLQ